MLSYPLRHMRKAVSMFLLLVVLLGTGAFSLSADAASPDAITLGDFVWREGRSPAGRNGMQDAGELGIPFAPVNLYAANGTTLLATTNANASGIYSLPATENTQYVIAMPFPSNNVSGEGLVGTLANVAPDTVDSDVDPVTRRANITTGTVNNATIDGGFYDSARSMTYCTGKQMDFTDWTANLSLLKADPSYGVLTGVYLRGSVGSIQQGTISNTTTTPQTISRYTGGAEVELDLPDDLLIVATERRINNITVNPGQTIPLGPIIEFATGDHTVAGADFPLYQGNGGFDDYFTLPATAFGQFGITGGANVNLQIQTQAYATVCVTYVFQLPLSVTLAAFEAQCRADDTIDVDWETVSEVDTLGFNVRRSSNAESPGEIVNPELIPAQAPGGGGATYHWADEQIAEQGTYYYWLEEVDTAGNVTPHGPVSASVPCASPTSVTLSALESSAAPLGWRWSVGLVGIALAGAGVIAYRRRR